MDEISISKSKYLSKEDIKSILHKIEDVKVGIVGDGCIDIYWNADMTLSELSRETPNYPLPIVNEKISLGACANVAANIKELKPKYVTILTVLGRDWRGKELIKILKTHGIDTSNLIVSETRITPAYCKPIRRGISDVVYEDPRIDFENLSEISPEDENQILHQLNVMANQVDIIAVSDQFNYGVVTEKVRKRLEELSKSGKTVVVDSRKQIHKYKNVIVKPNEVECIKAVDPDGNIKNITEEDIFVAAGKLYKITQNPLIITYGSKGSLWYENSKLMVAPTKPAEPPIDIVGAGDTFLSAFCCAYASKIPGEKAISFANIASSVVVKKIGTTGTASPSEILEKAGELEDEEF